MQAGYACISVEEALQRAGTEDTEQAVHGGVLISALETSVNF